VERRALRGAPDRIRFRGRGGPGGGLGRSRGRDAVGSPPSPATRACATPSRFRGELSRSDSCVRSPAPQDAINDIGKKGKNYNYPKDDNADRRIALSSASGCLATPAPIVTRCASARWSPACCCWPPVARGILASGDGRGRSIGRAVTIVALTRLSPRLARRGLLRSSCARSRLKRRWSERWRQ
jgi:hypothetical protein